MSQYTKVQSEKISIETGRGHPPHLDIRCCRPPKANPSFPTVLFLPFWGGSASTFEAVQFRLGETHSAHISIAVSYRGTGESHVDSELDPVEIHDIPSLAADVLVLLQSLGSSEDESCMIPSGKVVLCAHSMSAKVAWELLHGLTIRPDTSLTVTALLLLAPAPIGPLEFPAEMREQQLKAYNTLESASWTLRNVLTHKSLGDDVIARLARDCVSMSAGAKRGWIELGMKRDCLDVVRKVAAKLADQSDMQAFRVRVLVGEEDQVETAEKVKRETVDVLNELGFELVVESKVVAGVGHLLPVEAPEEVVTELGSLL